MNTLTHPAAVSRDPRQLASDLGVLAAQAALPGPRSRLLPTLDRILQRNQVRESLAAKVHATHFIQGD